MFSEAREIAGKKPKVLISDGAYNFHRAYNKEYWTRKRPRTQHVQHIHLAGDKNNNRMETFNGELRDREKTMRSVKIDDSPVLKGMQIFHNYVRPHMALEGKTPAEAAGFRLKGRTSGLRLSRTRSAKLFLQTLSNCNSIINAV